MTAKAAYDEKFVHFVVLFNVDRDYFECHEVMEELWLEEGRNTLYQGLLQAAVGLHHWRNDNYSGAVKLFDQAQNKLIQYPEVIMGLDLGQLRADIQRSVEPLRQWVEASRADGLESKQEQVAGGEQLNAAVRLIGQEPSKVRNVKGQDEPSNVGYMNEQTELAQPKPPVFSPFEVVVVEDRLRQLAEALAEVPLEIRLHNEDHEG